MADDLSRGRLESLADVQQLGEQCATRPRQYSYRPSTETFPTCPVPEAGRHRNSCAGPASGLVTRGGLWRERVFCRPCRSSEPGDRVTCRSASLHRALTQTTDAWLDRRVCHCERTDRRPMSAVVCTVYGPPDVLQLRDVAKPVPKDNEALVRIHATTVTTADCELRRFDFASWIWLPMRLGSGIRRPRRPVLGHELAGDVVSVGKDVRSLRKGDQVFATTSSREGRHHRGG